MKKTILLVLVLTFALASVGLAVEDTWTQKTDMPIARAWISGCVVDGKIYIIGGAPNVSSVTSAVEVYDPITDTWTRKANMPSARCYTATCTFDGKIYVFGGCSPNMWSAAKKNVYVYDPQIDTWTQKSDMPYANAYCGIAVVDSTIYLIGGGPDEPSPPIPTVMAYNPITESWTQKADMPTARGILSACVVDGKIYAIGGCTENWRVFSYKHVEVYNPSTNTWTRKSDMPTERWGLGTCVVDGKIFAIGGNSAESAYITANEVYDPITDTWTIKSPMQQKRAGLFVGSIRDKIYAIGGLYPNPNPILSTVEEYDTGLGVPSPDFNGDGIVDSADMCIMVDHWGENYPLCDIGPMPWGDDIVDVQDLIVLAEHLFDDYRAIAQWKLDEKAGGIAHDSVGGHDGTLHGEPIWQPTSGRLAGALEFDGIDDYISTPFILDPVKGSLSAFAWIKGGTSGQVIISQTGDFVGTWLGINPSGDNLMTGFSAIYFGALVSETVITDGQWHHVGFVYDTDTFHRRLYVDGAQVAEDTTAVAGLSSDGGMYIGVSKDLDAGTFFSGLIDDVRIYDVALTAEEIVALAQ